MDINNFPKLSWFGKLQHSVNKLPGPGWVWFFLLGVLLYGIAVIIQGFSAGFSNISVDPITYLVIFQLCYVSFLLNFLDNQAIDILNNFSPLLNSTAPDNATLKQRFTYLPPQVVNRLTLGTGLIFTFMGYFLFGLASDSGIQAEATEISFAVSPLGYYQFLIFSLMWLTNIIFIYHTIRQIKALSFVLAECMEVNIFNQTGLYSFTKLGASTAIGLVLSSPIWLFFDSGIISFIINIVFSIGAIFIFLFPLFGIHKLLVKQKSDLLSKSQQNKEKIIHKLFSQINQDDYSKSAEYDKALAALGSAHQEIKAISTWPWDNETIRRLSGAIVLPIGIWLVQFFLTRWLSA